MATYTWSYNATQIITEALGYAGVIGEGETPNTTQLNNGLDKLNALIKHYMTMGLPLWSVVPATLNFVQGQAVYNLLTAVPLPGRAVKLVQAYLHDNISQTDISVMALSRDEYLRLGNKTSQGAPIQYYYDPTQLDGQLYVWPTPDAYSAANRTFNFWYQLPFQDVALTDTPNFPDEWYRVLIWELAADLAEFYQVAADKIERLRGTAEDYYIKAVNFNMEEASMFFSPNDQFGAHEGM